MTKFSQEERTLKLVDVSGSGEEHAQFDLVIWVEAGYARARFGGEPVLITPEMAARIRASCEKQS